MASVILFNKPYGVLSQFREDKNTAFATLGQFFTDKSLRVAGRLDATSEGLLILTAFGAVNQVLTQPDRVLAGKAFAKTYLVQVEGVPNSDQLAQLARGVLLKDGLTLPALVEVVAECDLPMPLWQRDPPIRQRKNIPTTWLKMTIFEGKNRQVRRMTAHVGLPCLRLIRWSVGRFELGSLAVGSFVRVHLSKNWQEKYRS